MASDLTNHLPNATVSAKEPVRNHRGMLKIMQNLACIYKLRIHNCATNSEHFVRVHVKSLNVVVYEPCHGETCLCRCTAWQQSDVESAGTYA